MGDLGAICCADAGCPFGGVLILVADVDEGAMRALDVDLAFEIARCRVLVERGKELGMAIIVALLDGGGELPPAEDLELFSQFVAMADLAVVPCGISVHALDDRIPVLALDTSADLEAVLRTLFAP